VILTRLVESPSFGCDDPDDSLVWRITVGNVEDEDAARASLVDELDEIDPDWRGHLDVG